MKKSLLPLVLLFSLSIIQKTIGQKGQILTVPSLQSSITKAINQSCQYEGEVQLSNPFYKTLFTKEGIKMYPKNNNIIWHWSMLFVGGESVPTINPQLKETPAQEYVDYERGNITERYLFKGNHIEQVFVIQNPPKGDLEIEGQIRSEGHFEKNHNYWHWKNEKGAITLGELFVYDAEGKTIPALFEVNADCTSIQIKKEDLAQAIFPITIDPEIGTDTRLSDMGPDGSTSYEAKEPGIAYNSTDNQYLVVWEGDDNTAPLVNGEFEIFGQIVNADGTEDGTDFRISDMGPDGNTSYDASDPSVAYNSTDNQYLVVWDGDDNTPPLVESEVEIFGQLINADGTEDGTDFRISDMGPNGNANYHANKPCVTYNSTDNQYFVVWDSDDDSGSLVDDEFEIFGQIINADGTESGGDIRLSDMGPDGTSIYQAFNPCVAYNSADNQYLVVWDGDDNTAPLVESEFEIFGQLVNADGTEDGTDFRISDMGPNGNTSYNAFAASVAYNSDDNEFLVVWYGDDDTGSLINGEFEIFGQLINADGTESGSDTRYSDMGPDGNTSYSGNRPSVVFNSTDKQYFVVWHGDDNTAPLVDGETEIFGQLVNADGTESGNDTRLSDMGPNGNTVFDAFEASVAFNSSDNQYMVVWHGDDDSGSLINGEFEIYGQRYSSGALPVELTRFNGRAVEKGNLLFWQTASENNNKGFEIEHSENGFDWLSLGFEKGTGNSFDIKNYSFLHSNPSAGINYYRLKQIDFDGQFEYSDRITVDYRNDGIDYDFQVFPNPVSNGFLTVYLPENESENVDIIFFNFAGQSVRQFRVNNFKTVLNVSDLDKGMYLIKMNIAGQTSWNRVVIQ